MKIAIEAQRIFRTNKHGMDFVALETIRQLQKIDKENEYFIFVSPGEDHCLEESDNFRIIEVKCPTYPLWEQWALPRAVNKVKPDILHCTSNTAPIFCKVPLVLTLHDIIFLEPRQQSSKSLYQNMGWHYRKAVVPKILPHCLKIITVSEFERCRIEDKLKLGNNTIVAIYNGYSSHFRQVADTKAVTSKYIGGDIPYIFFLGNTDPKKNTPRTLKAYSLYLAQSKSPKHLLIADLKEPLVEQILKDEGLESIRPYIHYSGYIPNIELPYIYSGAAAFLYTSLRESFGIPILEGMASGTPVITSNVSAMPEIAGSGGILTDPMNPEAIAAELLRLETDQEYRKEQIAYGLERVKKFSWEETAKNVLKLYKSLDK